MNAVRTSTILLAALLAAGCASRADVEATAPVRPDSPGLALVGDSVVYRELTVANTGIEQESGDTLRLSARHDAVINVTRWAPDTLLAWYEMLYMRVRGPDLDTRPNTSAVLYAPFIMLIGEDGELDVRATPPTPPELAGMTDVRQQFEDFFVRVPADKRTIGATWSDTTELDLPPTPQGEVFRRATTDYAVTGDTVMHGLPALVVEYVTRIEMGSAGSAPQGATLGTELSGVERGTAVYAPVREVMLERRRVGELEGEITMTAAEGEPITRAQRYDYNSTIELLPPPDPDAEPDAERAAPVEPQRPT